MPNVTLHRSVVCRTLGHYLDTLEEIYIEMQTCLSVMSGVEGLLHGSWSWFLKCDVMTDVVRLRTVYKVLRRTHI